MNIVHSGWNNREFMWSFEDYFYNELGFGKADIHNCERILGRNFSYFIFEEDDKNWMVLLDADDGSGIASDNYKLNEDAFNKLKETYNVTDYIVFKMQYSSRAPHNSFYPLAEKTHPLGYFPYFPDQIDEYKRSVDMMQTPTIDFLWMGTVNYEDNPPVWPDGLDKEHWQLGQRIKGFEMIQSIKEKRPDLNIVVSSDRIQYYDYLDLVAKSKVCLELPGVGNFTTRFFENLKMGKCILGKRLYLELPYDIIADKHYIALDDWSEMEEAMDYLVENKKTRYTVMRNVRELWPKLTYQYALDSMLYNIRKHLTMKITYK
tara:strand:+ start:3888 stop:4841 length:954 start_codon:yes stop_codon:yes gene_type:complete